MRDVSQYFELIEKAIEYSPYDNAPHHTHISTHPHHKHVGAKILPALEPEFSQVLNEGVALLIEDTGHVKRSGKKRRQRTSKKS
jgi:hypothetical protein